MSGVKRRRAVRIARGLLVATLWLGPAIPLGCSDERDMFASGPIMEVPPRDGGTPTDTDAATPEPPSALILVHAADAPAFRLCFEGLAGPPMPDESLMPESNVVGVEVGSAVRLPAPRGVLGRAWFFEETLLRDRFLARTTCAELLTMVNPMVTMAAVELDPVMTDLSDGVHLLVLTGCAGDSLLRQKSTAECGEDYDPDKGNLRLRERRLFARPREPGELPLQVVHLAEAIERHRAGRHLSIGYGALGAPDATLADAGSSPAEGPGSPASTMTTVTTDPALFEVPDTAANVRLNLEVGAGAFRDFGFHAALTDDAGVTETLFDQALASVQYLSSPLEIPATFYAVPSNYALLLLGDPSPKRADGGLDGDERRRAHLLAIPVADPLADAGTSAVARP